MIIGLVSGFYYCEITKAEPFTGDTQLVSCTPTCSCSAFFLIVLMLELQFALSTVRLFDWSFWVHNADVTVTVAMMVHGTLTVLGKESGDAIAMVDGWGTSC